MEFGVLEEEDNSIIGKKKVDEMASAA
jgi:hypothetical protein